jgi:tRNA modification GTPase
LLDKSLTIVACATPLGRGGVSIVRLSGSDVCAFIPLLTRLSDTPIAKQAIFTHFYYLDQSILDQGILIYFKGPNSFTGEDVLECQVHGSPYVVDALIQTAIYHGARLARPGEFSERAFLNGKMDLVQAEAVADLIHAGSQKAAQSAMYSLQGVFSHLIQEMAKKVLHLRIYIEAALDFADEEIDFLSDGAVFFQLEEIFNQIHQLKLQIKSGILLQEGLKVALVGAPNAGKSSWLNRLLGEDRAIVSDIAGTTRDSIRVMGQIQGVPVEWIDTAGIRETVDPIEAEGVKRSYLIIQQAQAILWLVDATFAFDITQLQAHFELFQPINLSEKRIILGLNKWDLLSDIQKSALKNNIKYFQEIYAIDVVELSAKTGEGLGALEACLLADFSEADQSGLFIARRRHWACIERAHEALLRTKSELVDWPEVAAESLKDAHLALCEMTGEFTQDDLLGAIFSSFCVGK